MIQRRNFLSIAAMAVPAAAAVSLASEAYAQRAGSNSCLPDPAKLKTRTAAKTEVLYKTKHGQPNGLAVTKTPGELWVIDQGNEHWVTLTHIADGSTIREFQADVVGPSGIVIDDDNVMWVTSTHNSLIVSIDPANGKTIAKYVTPGAGRIYKKAGDPAPRVTKQPRAYPDLSRAVGGGAQQARVGGAGLGQTAAKLPAGQVALDTEEGAGGTGAHGILSKGDLLIYVCPPSRAIFVINKKTWEVQDVWPTAGNRPHGITWADASKTSFWNVDSNTNTFYHYDAMSGEIKEAVVVQDDPYTVCHGAKLVNGYMYFCDDVGWICRIKWA
jgi:DNA-binding beta-propeller fold protein YncE